MRFTRRRRRQIADPHALDAYATGGFRTIEGWNGSDVMWTIAELSRQQLEMGERGPVAEIGVHHGQLFVLLALVTGRAETAVGVDLFEDQDGNVDASGRGDRAVLEENLASHGVDRNRVELLQTNSLELSGADVVTAGNGRVRLFSVDGGHTAEVTENDLVVASDALSKNGIVILDDAFSSMWPGVMTGLLRFMEHHPGALAPFGLVGNKTLLARPAVAPAWYAALEPAAEFYAGRIDLFLDHPVRILLEAHGHINEWRPHPPS